MQFKILYWKQKDSQIKLFSPFPLIPTPLYNLPFFLVYMFVIFPLFFLHFCIVFVLFCVIVISTILYAKFTEEKIPDKTISVFWSNPWTNFKHFSGYWLICCICYCICIYVFYFGSEINIIIIIIIIIIIFFKFWGELWCSNRENMKNTKKIKD